MTNVTSYHVRHDVSAEAPVRSRLQIARHVQLVRVAEGARALLSEAQNQLSHQTCCAQILLGGWWIILLFICIF